ncbi:hypothetical protein [Massilia sp. KIM]|nr:hypothetical protein [Massilia sp. KIM]
MGAFDPLIPWPSRTQDDKNKPAEQPAPTAPEKRIPIGPTDI